MNQPDGLDRTRAARRPERPTRRPSIIQSVRFAAVALVAALLLAGTAALAAGTAPVLGSTSPASGATVKAAATVSAAYDQTLSAASTLVVTDNSALAVAGSSGLSPAGTAVVYTPNSPLTQAGSPYAATATAKNAANDAQTVSTWSFSVDTTAPAAPAITSVNGDTTSPASGNDTTPSIVVSGVVAGDTVSVLEGATVAGTAVVPAAATSVTFNATPSPTDVTLALDGNHVLTATSTDPATNASAPSAAFSYTLDTSAAAVPAITSVNGSTSTPAVGNDPTPAIVVGGVTAGDTVRILEGATVLASKVVPVNPIPGPTSVLFNAGAADSEVTLTEGSHSLTADAADPAGNVSAASAAFVYALNTAAPSTPVIAAVNNVTLSPAVGNDVTPSIVVSGVTAGDTVRLLDGAVVKSTKVVPASATTVSFNAGALDADATVTGNGDHSLTATATNPGGNVSGASGAFIYTLDTGTRSPLLVSTIPADQATTKSQPVSATFDERLDRTASTLTVTNTSGNSVGGATSFSPDSQTIVFTAALTEAGNSYTAHAVVKDGNGNTTTSNWTFRVDTAAPAVPAIASVAGDATTPASGVDASPPIVVSGVIAGDTVRILEGAIVRGTKMVPAAATTVTFNAGAADTDVVVTGDGIHTLTATASDPAGNVSGVSDPFVYELTATFAGEFHALDPARILDTRFGTGGITGPIGPDGTISATVVGVGGVPATGVSAVVVNVTVTQPSVGGYLTVFPAGTTRPVASNLNFVAGENVPNLVVAKVGAAGQVSIYNPTGTTHVVFDVVGWYSDATGPVGSKYNALTPARILDTRFGTGGISAPVGPGGTAAATVVGVGGVPATGVSAVVVNVTATQPSAGGFLTVFPSGSARPNASNLNFVAGQTVPNLVVAKVGTDGTISIFNQAGTTHVVMDVVGWFGVDGAAAGSLYTPLDPARILDTRFGTGGFNEPIGPLGTISATVVGVGGVPATGVSAVVVNVTVTQPSVGGYLTVFPSGTSRPVASNLNFEAGENVPNLVVAKVGADGKVAIYNQAGTTHVIMDVVGWYGG